MIISLKNETNEKDLKKILDQLTSLHIRHLVTKNKENAVIGTEKSLEAELLKEIKKLSSVSQVSEPKVPYQLASLEHKKEKSVVWVKDVPIGGEEVVLMAGPCAIESLEQLVEIGRLLKQCGVKILRASAYKPRSSPYSFQGLGEEGLKMHKEAQKNHGLLIETEVMDPRDVQMTAEYVDIIRVGARNMQNFDLLKELGRCGKPVILKRGLSSTIEEWLLSAEYLLAYGNPNVILCERGIRTFETMTRGTLDLSSVPVAKRLTHLPIIIDPSHAAGRADIIPDLSKAAVAVGADGLLIEVHPRPRESVCDAKQALSPQEFSKLSEDLQRIAAAVHRRIEGGKL
ncbi:MAG: 3-deoxy-7-phosphoheptulonate synthase [Simkaniaceae bacterium]